MVAVKEMELDVIWSPSLPAKRKTMIRRNNSAALEGNDSIRNGWKFLPSSLVEAMEEERE